MGARDSTRLMDICYPQPSTTTSTFTSTSTTTGFVNSQLWRTFYVDVDVDVLVHVVDY